MLIETVKNLGPEFFDIFGVLVFTYVIFYSQTILSKRKLPKGFTVLLLLIGLAGLFIDLLFASSFFQGLM